MIKNFHKVNKNLYRGAKPSVADVILLVKKLGIEKIISLDKSCGENIEPFCKKLGIDQIIIDIDPSNIKTLKNLLSYNITQLLDPNIKTFVHCRRGKDRVGLLIALERCILENWNSTDAIKEAKKLGFGTGLDLPVERFYTKLIERANKKDKDDSNYSYDIVTNVADSTDIYRDEQFDPYAPSFAPFVDSGYRKYPESFVDLKPYDEQYETRENYGLKGINTEEQENIKVPAVGVYDQNSQITNLVGPSLIGSGFV